MAHYSSDKRPAELDSAVALADADVMVVQKDGENYTRKVPIAVLKADITGAEYRSDEEALTSGVNLVTFSSPLPDATYSLFYYTRTADGYEIQGEITSTTAASFGITVPADCTLTYYAVPKN